VRDVVSAILGGGRGTRLWPLTMRRAKPAVPVGGKFRLIDIPISNSLHAGIERIYVLTQFLSASLHRHISQTYRFDAFSSGFVNILAAEQRIHEERWYQGTADAIRQNMPRLIEFQPRDILILSGDQLYLMDMAAFVGTHREHEADLTVAVKPVPRAEASALGIMRIDEAGRITEFVEKPTDSEVIDGLALDAATIERLGIQAQPGMVLASMGIYTFRTRFLEQVLGQTDHVDFGREVIPQAIKSGRVHAFVEPGYWRDIGTIRSFHEANLELTAAVPDLNLYDPDHPVYTRPRFLPGCKINGCTIERSILSDGAIVSASRVSDSIVGLRARLAEGVELDRTVMMGATAYQTQSEGPDDMPLGIGAGTVVRNAILDLDARIGCNCRLTNESGIQHLDAETHVIRDGIIVVPRGRVVPDGTVV
jgi:glucose-1-phosphate adenylyltransferase